MSHSPSEFNTARFKVRMLPYSLHTEVLQMVHFAYFHSMINYGLIFSGNSTNLHYKKRIIQIMSGA
jgi:hypothetical protein